MSRLSRLRRRNRLERQSLATREPSGSLGLRGLRFSNLRLSHLRERKRFEKITNFFPDPKEDFVDTLVNRYNRNNNLDILGLARDVKNTQDVLEQRKIRARVSREKRKPLNVIQLNGKVRVDLPPEHPICVARHERREVLFALGKSGKGGQRPRRNDNNITLRCK